MQLPKEIDLQINPGYGLKAWVTDERYIAFANVPQVGNEDEGIVLLNANEARTLLEHLSDLIDLAEQNISAE